MKKIEKIGKLNILRIITIFLLFITLFISKEHSSNALTFSSAILALLSCELLFDKNKACFDKISKREDIALAILSIFSVLMISASKIINESLLPMIESYNIAIEIILITAYFGLLSYCTYLLLKTFYHYYFLIGKDDSNKNDASICKKCWIAIIVVSLIFFISSFYTITFPDINIVYYQVETKNYNEWHTIGYLLFDKICLSVFPEGLYVLPVTLVQTIIWIFINKYIISSLYKYFKTVKPIKAYTLMSAMVFTPYIYLELAIKDTVISMFMLAFSVSIFNVVNKEKIKKYDLIMLVVNASFASIFRHFAIVVVLISLFAIFLYRTIKYKKFTDVKKGICVMLIPIICYVGVVSGVGQGIWHAKKNPEYVKYTVPIYLAVATISELDSNDIKKEYTKTLEKIAPVEEWKRCYKEDIYWADEVTRAWGEIGTPIFNVKNEIGNEFVKINFDLLLTHPIKYITSWAHISSIIWEVTTPNDCKSFYAPNPDTFDDDNVNYQNNVASKMTNPLIRLIENNAVLTSIYLRGGLWLIITLLSSIVLIKKKKANLLFVLLPVFTYIASLLLSIPAQDPRYVLPLIEVGIFYSTIAYFEKSSQKT